MELFLGALLLIFLLGYLAQTTGLCMVRGMNECLAGNPGFLIAILLCGIWAWVAALTAYFLGVDLHLRAFEASVWFFIGGLLFGMGTAFNQGCGVSTLSKLSRGELSMLATLGGWIIGWTALAFMQFQVEVIERPQPSKNTFIILIAFCVVVSIWVLRGDLIRKKTWFGMMGIGLIAGFLFLIEPGWTPSGLLHDLSNAFFLEENGAWPATTRYLLFIALLAGMALAAWRGKRFQLNVAHRKVWLGHALAGTLMGVGASIAIGGNDSQLLLALPALSPAGFLAVIGILAGIYVGIRIRRLVL